MRVPDFHVRPKPSATPSKDPLSQSMVARSRQCGIRIDDQYDHHERQQSIATRAIDYWQEARFRELMLTDKRSLVDLMGVEADKAAWPTYLCCVQQMGHGVRDGALLLNLRMIRLEDCRSQGRRRWWRRSASGRPLRTFRRAGTTT